MKAITIDNDIISDIQSRAGQLIGIYSARDAMYEDLRQLLHMEWKDAPRGDWIKETMSPGAYNALIGAVRLMTSSEPQFSVPFDETDAEARDVSEKIEGAARYMWSGSGRVSLRPVHYDAVFAGLAFGEIAGSVQRTSDLLAYAEQSDNRGLANRMRRVVGQTPYLFTVYNPITCYPDFDGFGLRALLRRSQTTWGEIVTQWGVHAEQSIGGGVRQPYEKVTINDWYDWQYRMVWMDGAAPIWAAEHGLSFLPVVDQITEGTSLFVEPERQRFPLLYPVLKSGLWRRENLSLTVIYSLIHSLGSNPLLLYETDDPDNVQLRIDRTVPGGLLPIRKGERVGSLMEKIVDPSQWQGLDTAQRLNEESTISKMTLGSAPVSDLPFSAISLLSQSGRLPLVSVKQMTGQAISNLVMAALDWWRDDAGGVRFYNRNRQVIDLTPDEIPERIALMTSLEPDVPTDKLQLANIAERLVQSGMTSKRWARENILQVGQSTAMDREILFEQMDTFSVQRALQRLTAQDQQELQQAAAQAQQQHHIGQQMAAMESQFDQGGQPSGNESAYLNGAVGPGAPLSGPLPPNGAAR